MASIRESSQGLVSKNRQIRNSPASVRPITIDCKGNPVCSEILAGVIHILIGMNKCPMVT